MKQLLAIFFLSFGLSASAQTGAYNTMQIYNNLVLKGHRVTGISSDSTFATADEMNIPTALAVKKFVLANSGSVIKKVKYVTSNYTITGADSMLVVTGGSVVIDFPDPSSFLGKSIIISADYLTGDVLFGDVTFTGYNPKYNGTTIISLAPNTSAEFISDGTVWNKVASSHLFYIYNKPIGDEEIAITNNAGNWSTTGRIGVAALKRLSAGVGINLSSDINAITVKVDTGMIVTPYQLDTAKQNLRNDISASVSGVSSINGNTGAITLNKSDVGLTNVDNTADVNKPVSAAMKDSLDLKLNAADAFTKTRADTLYKDKDYAPAWGDVTGKPALVSAGDTISMLAPYAKEADINEQLAAKRDTSYHEEILLDSSLSFDSATQKLGVSQAVKNKLMPDLTNRNFVNDSLAVINGSLHPGDWYRDGNVVKVVTTLPTSFAIKFKVAAGYSDSINFTPGHDGVNYFKYTVYWGDGSYVDTLASGTAVGHKYAAAGDYTINVITNNNAYVRKFDINEMADSLYVSDIKYQNLFSTLRQFSITKANLNAFIDTFNFNNNLQVLIINKCKIAGMNYSIPSSLQTLRLQGCNYTAWSRTLPVGLREFNVGYQVPVLTVAQVNTLLQWFDSQTFTYATPLLYTKYNGAIPSGSGATAKASLQSKGWTVTTD